MAHISIRQLRKLVTMAMDRAERVHHALEGSDNPQVNRACEAAKVRMDVYRNVLAAIDGDSVLLSIDAGPQEQQAKDVQL